jgi:hypothetical protein
VALSASLIPGGRYDVVVFCRVYDSASKHGRANTGHPITRITHTGRIADNGESDEESGFALSGMIRVAVHRIRLCSCFFNGL